MKMLSTMIVVLGVMFASACFAEDNVVTWTKEETQAMLASANNNMPIIQQQVSNVCQTPAGWCFMAAYGPIGGSCWCPSPYGPVGGYIRY